MIVVYQDSKVRNNCSQSEGMKDKKDITVDKTLRSFQEVVLFIFVLSISRSQCSMSHDETIRKNSRSYNIF